MKRTWIFAALSAVSVITLFSSCFTGLDPAWKVQGTRFAITLPEVAETPAESRALVQGVGFLYIRTLGGPSGPVGPAYGPFPVDKSTFETKLIPPGRFDSFLVLYSSVLLDDKEVGTSGKTFREVISLPEAELEAFFEHEEDSPSIFDSFIDGYGSGAMTGSVTILDGIRNEIPSLTLEPIVASGYTAGTEGFTFSVSSPATTMTKRFFRLDGIDPESTFATLECSVKASSALGGMAGRIGLYEESGSLVRLFSPVGALSSGDVKTVSAPFTGNETYYLYLEYMGDFEVQCIGAQAVTPTGVTMQLAGSNAVLANHRVFFGVYDLSQVTPYGGMPDTVLAAGTFLLDASGNGTGEAYVPGTTSAPSLVPGTPYLVNYFVDVNDNYLGLTGFTDEVDASGITPHFGDYVSQEMEVFTAGEPIEVAGTDLVTSNGYVYFVSSSGTAVATGQVPSVPLNFDAALAKVQALRSSSEDVYFEIYLMDSFNLANPVLVNAPVTIRGLGSSPHTINLQNFPGKAAITLTTELDEIDASLELHNVIIEGNGQNYDMSAILVGEHSKLGLLNGTVIRNVKVPAGNGGAVSVQGGSLLMLNSEISGCAAKDGGGVHVSLSGETYGNIMLMPGAVIKNNVASLSGGGVYVTSGAVFYFYDADNTIAITGNVAEVDGGGVYIEEGGMLYDDLGLAATVIIDNALSDFSPSNLVYTAPPVSITVGSGLSFDVEYNYYDVPASELFEASAPAGFEQYQWTLNGFELPYTGSDVTFTWTTDINPAFWQFGDNYLSVLVLKDGQLYSSELHLIITE